MSKGIGNLIQIGIAKETTRGTAESAATYWIPWAELSVDEKDKRVIDEATIGVIEDSVGQSIVSQWSEATLKAPVGDKHLPLILLSTLGNISSALKSGETAVYEHTLSVLQSAQHPSLTLFSNDPLAGADYAYPLGVVKSFQLDYELEKFVEYTVEFIAKKGSSATLTPATTTEHRFLPQNLTFKIATNKSGLDAASATSIKKLTLKIEKNVEPDDVLGSTDPADFLNKQFSITGELEAIWQNESDFKTAALAGSTKAMRIDLVGSDSIGVASSPRLKIDLDKVIFEPIERTISLNDLVIQRVAFKAYYDTANSSMVSMVVTNEVASY